MRKETQPLLSFNRETSPPRDFLSRVDRERQKNEEMRRKVNSQVEQAGKTYTHLLRLQALARTADENWDDLLVSTVLATGKKEELIREVVEEDERRRFLDTPLATCLLAGLAVASMVGSAMSTRVRKPTAEETTAAEDAALIARLEKKKEGRPIEGDPKKDLKRFQRLLAQREKLSEKLARLEGKGISLQRLLVKGDLERVLRQRQKILHQWLTEEKLQTIRESPVKNPIPLRFQVPTMVIAGAGAQILALVPLPTAAAVYATEKAYLSILKSQTKIQDNELVLKPGAVESLATYFLNKELSKKRLERIRPPNPITNFVERQEPDKEADEAIWIRNTAFRAGTEGEKIPKTLLARKPGESDIKTGARRLVAAAAHRLGLATRACITEALLGHLAQSYNQSLRRQKQLLEREPYPGETAPLEVAAWSNLSVENYEEACQRAYEEQVMGRDSLTPYSHFQEMAQTDPQATWQELERYRKTELPEISKMLLEAQNKIEARLAYLTATSDLGFLRQLIIYSLASQALGKMGR